MRLLFHLAMLGGSLAFLFASMRLSAAAGAVPFLVATSVSALLALDLAVRPRSAAARVPERRSGECAALSWATALPLIVTLLGIVAGPAIYCGVYARWNLRAKPWLALALAALVLLLLAALFERLPVRPAAGIVENLLSG